MSIETSIIEALAGIASNHVYPDAAPQDTPLPLVTYKTIDREPLNTLQGYAGITRSIIRFDCWAKTKAEALSLAASVVAAIHAYAGIQNKYQESPGASDYEPAVDQFVEPVQFTFWHP